MKWFFIVNKNNVFDQFLKSEIYNSKCIRTDFTLHFEETISISVISY